MEISNLVLPFRSFNEILRSDHVNETSSAVLLRGTTCFLIFYKMKFQIFLEFQFLALLRVKGLSGSPLKAVRLTNNSFLLFFAGEKALVHMYEIHNSSFQILYFCSATSKKTNSGCLSLFNGDLKTKIDGF